MTNPFENGPVDPTANKPGMCLGPMGPTRQMPHCIEVEEALLGALLLNNNCYEKVSDLLKPQHFYVLMHQDIYDCIEKTLQAGLAANPITLKQFFTEEGKDYPVGDHTVSQYMGHLVAESATIISVGDYAKIIKEMAMRRALIGVGEEMVFEAYDAGIDADILEVIARAEQALYSVAESGSDANQARTMTEIVPSVLSSIKEACERGAALAGIPTGLKDLDNKIGGLRKTDVVILAAATGAGKTSFATTIAANIAKKGHSVSIFSLEMSSEQLVSRLIAAESKISSTRLERGDLGYQEEYNLSQASTLIQGLPISINDTSAISIGQLYSLARRQKRLFGLDLLILDYLQLMRGDHYGGHGNRVQEIAEITRGLKALAKDLEVPILALAQISRQVEYRENKRPQLSDLRESGSIEQDADVVVFLYREEYYLIRDAPKNPSVEEECDFADKIRAVRGVAEAIIAKNRHGPTGIIQLVFNGELTLFTDLYKGDVR